MKTIEITIDASNMNPEELEKAIKTAIKTATMESGKNTEVIESVNEKLAVRKEIEEQLKAIRKLLIENLDEELTVDKLTKILKIYQEEEKRLKNIFRIK